MALDSSTYKKRAIHNNFLSSSTFATTNYDTTTVLCSPFPICHSIQDTSRWNWKIISLQKTTRCGELGKRTCAKFIYDQRFIRNINTHSVLFSFFFLLLLFFQQSMKHWDEKQLYNKTSDEEKKGFAREFYLIIQASSRVSTQPDHNSNST